MSIDERLSTARDELVILFGDTAAPAVDRLRRRSRRRRATRAASVTLAITAAVGVAVASRADEPRLIEPIPPATQVNTTAATPVNTTAATQVNTTAATQPNTTAATRLNATVNGSVSVTPNGCNGVVRATAHMSLTGSPALGPATLDTDICVRSALPNDPSSGTFVLTGSSGTITGTIVIISPDSPDAEPERLTGTLTPSGGTSRFARADQPLTLEVLLSGPYPRRVVGTLALAG